MPAQVRAVELRADQVGADPVGSATRDVGPQRLTDLGQQRSHLSAMRGAVDLLELVGRAVRELGRQRLSLLDLFRAAARPGGVPGPPPSARVTPSAAASPRRRQTSTSPWWLESRQSWPAKVTCTTCCPAPKQSKTAQPGKPWSRRVAWIWQPNSGPRFGHGRPAGLFKAKSADRAKAGATQHRPSQREQSALSSRRARSGARPSAASGHIGSGRNQRTPRRCSRARRWMRANPKPWVRAPSMS